MASFNTLFHKASSFLRLGSQVEATPCPPPSPSIISSCSNSSLNQQQQQRRRRNSNQSACPRPSSLTEGEVVFCKNNVCVHPPVPIRAEAIDHHPGYLCIRTRDDDQLGSTLILNWIPNATLKKNPRSLENRTPGTSPCRSQRSSACPSPTHSSLAGSSVSGGGGSHTHHPTSLPGNLRSGSASPSNNNDSRICYGDIGSIAFLCRGDSDRRSISSTVSDLGSPRDDLQSLDSWTTVDNALETSTPGSSISQDNTIDFTCNSCESSYIGPISHDGSPKQSSLLEKKDQLLPNGNGSTQNACQSQSQSDSGIGPEEVTAALESMISGLNDMDSHMNLPDGSKEELPSGPEPLPKTNTSQLNLTDMTLSQENAGSTTSTLKNQVIDFQQYGDQGSSSSTTPTTSNKDYPDSPDEDDELGMNSTAKGPLKLELLYVEGTPESLAHAHNLTFPDGAASHNHSHRRGSLVGSASLTGGGWSSQNNCHGDGSHSPGSRISASSSICNYSNVRESSCGLFSVDLSQMRSLRLFFCDKEQTCGQLVIASRESQYKILHFHNGGLDRLAQVFEEFNHLLSGSNINSNNVGGGIFRNHKKKEKDKNCPYRQFWVCRPQFTEAECHPEEGVYGPVDGEMWREFVNIDGQVEDDFQLRKAIFFGGLDRRLRKDVWPFLLRHYAFQTTFDEREQIRNDSYIEYQAIRRKRELMSAEEKDHFWKTVQCIIEKDVVRTDRSNPFFAGENNPNIKIMENILLSYAIYNPSIAYTQGMSDLLAPVLAEIHDEAESFWCFVGLMQKTIFFSSPKDTDMDVNLNYLLELLRLMTPDFYEYLSSIKDGYELLFAHRWILLCFKREFPESEALSMWEACWAHYQTDYFHLFLCLAIVAVYGSDVIEQGLRSDEMLLHFSSLALHMDGEVILRKARGLLHQFRTLAVIPCTLAKLCQLCGPGMWDSGHVPLLECRGSHPGLSCPYGGQESPYIKQGD